MSCHLHHTNSCVVSTKRMKEKIEKYGACFLFYVPGLRVYTCTPDRWSAREHIILCSMVLWYYIWYLVPGTRYLVPGTSTLVKSLLLGRSSTKPTPWYISTYAWKECHGIFVLCWSTFCESLILILPRNCVFFINRTNNRTPSITYL
jgi:hypothetical protein